MITLEHSIKINKTATALITGILCWAAYALMSTDAEAVGHQLEHHLTDTAEILFFLMGAMTVVELIDVHDGFTLITDRIASRNIRTLTLDCESARFLLVGLCWITSRPPLSWCRSLVN